MLHSERSYSSLWGSWWGVKRRKRHKNPPESGYLSFPQDTSEIPDPDTLEDYPYDPNINIPLDFTLLAYTEYPEPDSSELDSADLALMIPKGDSMIPIVEFLALSRMIPAETTLVRLIDEDTIMYSSGNDCSFSDNKRGDILLVTGKWYQHLYGYWTHAGMWLKSTGDKAYRTITSHKDNDNPARNGVHYEHQDHWNDWYPRCAVFRVHTWPKSTSLRSQAGDYAEAKLGKPYNIWINWKYTQRRFYCSQLDWAGYWWKSNCLVNVDINLPIYLPGWGLVPDWHVLPDELFLSWRTFKIADSNN